MRYQFLSKNDVFEALNKIRAALLAANNGKEVDSIIKGVLTHDERMKIGRRVQIAQMIIDGFGHDEIKKELKVGSSTITTVLSKLSQYPECFEYINEREKKVEKVFKRKAYKKVGGAKLVYKKTEYTGYNRENVER